MSNFIQLLLPGCKPLENMQEKPKFYNSAILHAITAIVLAIVLALGAAAAAYFLTHHVILWTAIAGGGSAVVVTLLTYIALRCLLGHRNRGPEAPTGALSEATTTSLPSTL